MTPDDEKDIDGDDSAVEKMPRGFTIGDAIVMARKQQTSASKKKWRSVKS